MYIYDNIASIFCLVYGIPICIYYIIMAVFGDSGHGTFEPIHSRQFRFRDVQSSKNYIVR